MTKKIPRGKHRAGTAVRSALTEKIVAEAVCPADRASTLLWDDTQRGLVLRVYRSGSRSYYASWRQPGGGRRETQRWLRLGSADAMALKDARDAARIKMGEVAKGVDPAAARREERRRERALLEPALEAYEAALAARQVVKTKEIMSLLRRELLAPLGDVDLAMLDRATLIARIDMVRRSSRPGAAKELRSRAGVFLGWAVDQGLIAGNPLAGWRQPRRTRAERLERRGRALADAELAGFWRGAETQGWPFGPYLQLLLLIGQRRTETARMAWSDLVLDDGAGLVLWPDLPPQTNLCRVPPAITKSGRPHFIPLPRQAVALLKRLPRLNRCDFVFPGRRATPMTGWSKRLPDAYSATAKEGVATWTPHDLRRTMRTGLGRLGVDRVISDLLLDHAISDELAAIYDRGAYWPARVEAAQRWADYIFAQLKKTVPPSPWPASVVDLAEVRR
jgi:integrase